MGGVVGRPTQRTRGEPIVGGAGHDLVLIAGGPKTASESESRLRPSRAYSYRLVSERAAPRLTMRDAIWACHRRLASCGGNVARSPCGRTAVFGVSEPQGAFYTLGRMNGPAVSRDPNGIISYSTHGKVSVHLTQTAVQRIWASDHAGQ